MKVVLLYLIMTVFDLCVLAGLIHVLEKGWSNNWIILAVLLLAGSYPGSFLKAEK